MAQKNTRSQLSIFYQVLIAAVFTNFANGSAYVWSVYSSELMSGDGWTATMATLPYTLNVVVSSLSPVVGAMVYDKFGPKWAVRLAGLCYFLGWFICGVATNPWVLIICFGLFAGSAQGINPNATTSTAIKWAPAEKKGMASGISMSANGFSSIYMAPLGAVLLAVGLNTAFRTMGIITLVICFLGSMFLVTPPKEMMSKATGAQEVKGLTIQEVLKTKRFWLLFFLYMFSLIGGGMVFSQCASIARVQADWNAGYVLVAILALANGTGRIFYNSLSDKIGVYRTFYIMFGLELLAMVLFVFANTIPMLIVCVFLVGSAFGGTNSITYPALASEFGTRSQSQMNAYVSIAYLFQGLLGATIAAAALDMTGSYIGAYMIGAGCLAVTLVLCKLMHKESIKCAAQNR